MAITTTLGVMAPNTLLGRFSPGVGPAEEVPCTSAGRALLSAASASAQLVVLGLSGVSNPLSAKKTSDQIFSVPTPANVTGMSFAVTGGHYYRFHFMVVFRSPTASVGVKLAATCPALPTCFAYTARIMTGGDGAGAERQGSGTTSGDVVIGTGVASTNTDYIAEVLGVLIPSAGGTLQLQAANETGAVTVIIRQGTLGYLWDHGT
jgi:hypothetical protein